MKKHYLLASDFDQTLSFNDSGIVLSEMLGITSFREKVAALSNLNLVQQGAELAYLLANDPEYARVTRNDLLKVGRQVRLKRNVELLTRMLAQGIDGNRFDFYVISAAPQEVVLSALEGIVPADHVVGTRFEFQPGDDKISEAREIAQIAKRTVISDDALSVLVPILEEIAGFGPSQIRALFEDQGLVIQEWDRVRTDWLTIRDGAGDGITRLDAVAGA